MEEKLNEKVIKQVSVYLYTALGLLLFSTMFAHYGGLIEGRLLTKYYAFILGSVLYGFGTILFNRKGISFDKISLLVCLIAGYLLLRMIAGGICITSISILCLACFVILYFSLKADLVSIGRSASFIITAACLAQAGYGILQYFGLIYNPVSFSMVGSFDNPAGFAACLCAGYPFCFTVLNSKNRWSKYYGCMSIAVIIAAIFLSESRTAIFAVITVTSALIINHRLGFFKRGRKYTIALLLVFISICVLLFFLKKDSAVGRVLIWQNSLCMIADKALLGHGPDSFTAEYMLYQADYFEETPQSVYSRLADNVSHPFNEYILVTVEYGLVGVMMIIILIIAVFAVPGRISPPSMALLSIILFACFSYPMRYPFVWVMTAFCLASLNSGTMVRFRVPQAGKYFFVVLSAILIYATAQHMRFEYSWNKLAYKSFFLGKEESISGYSRLYDQWNGNPLFLYNYGAYLNRAGEYGNSNGILLECVGRWNDYDIQLLLGDNYAAMGDFENSEIHYHMAHNMIPCRFMPLYKLLILYESDGCSDKAFDIAEIIVNKQIKVQGNTVTQIRNRAVKFLEDYPR